MLGNLQHFTEICFSQSIGGYPVLIATTALRLSFVVVELRFTTCNDKLGRPITPATKADKNDKKLSNVCVFLQTLLAT